MTSHLYGFYFTVLKAAALTVRGGWWVFFMNNSCYFTIVSTGIIIWDARYIPFFKIIMESGAVWSARKVHILEVAVFESRLSHLLFIFIISGFLLFLLLLDSSLSNVSLNI